MTSHLEIEALETLINAVYHYQEELQTNRQILLNAASVCDAAMGNDDIAKKYIARLNESLVELQKTSQLAADISEALIRDKARAMAVYED